MSAVYISKLHQLEPLKCIKIYKYDKYDNLFTFVLGKAAISNQTACQIFAYLNRCGVKTHFVRQHDEKSLVARKCDMIPIEWVARRLATGSFLKRMPGVKEGYRFNPPKLETFFKDDANHDPQWSSEQLIEAKLTCAGLVIGPDEVDRSLLKAIQPGCYVQFSFSRLCSSTSYMYRVRCYTQSV